VDVLERPPVEVLAAEEDLLAVHDEELGVLDPARDRAQLDEAHFDPGHRAERVGGLRVGAVHARIQDQPHADAAFRGRADRVNHLVHRFARPGREVELLDVEGSRRTPDHLDPDRLRLGDRRVPEPALDRAGLDELDGRSGERDARVGEEGECHHRAKEHAPILMGARSAIQTGGWRGRRCAPTREAGARAGSSATRAGAARAKFPAE
jgi:hypothetical protein